MKLVLILDLDGTLLDTLEDLADSMNDALRGLGFPEHPLASYRRMIGDGAQMLAARAVPPWWQRDPATVDAAYTAYLGCYGRRWNLKTTPYPGIPDLLDACVGAGIRLAVLSNKADSFTQLIVEAFLPRWPWAVIRGQRAGTPRKPAPDGVLAIAAELGVAPSDCAFLGDSGVDMACAKAAGATGLGALWGFRDAGELTAHGARALVATPAEVRRWL